MLRSYFCAPRSSMYLCDCHCSRGHTHGAPTMACPQAARRPMLSALDYLHRTLVVRGAVLPQQGCTPSKHLFAQRFSSDDRPCFVELLVSLLSRSCHLDPIECPCCKVEWQSCQHIWREQVLPSRRSNRPNKVSSFHILFVNRNASSAIGL